jgi:hypothetical protein
MANKPAVQQKPKHPSVEGRPDWVVIGGRLWDIEWYVNQQDFERACFEVKDVTDLGAATFQWEMTIRMRTDLHITLQKENLLHECLHACWYSVVTHGDDEVDPRGRDWEEHFISGIDTPLLAMLRENPHVTKWLLS